MADRKGGAASGHEALRVSIHRIVKLVCPVGRAYTAAGQFGWRAGGRARQRGRRGGGQAQRGGSRGDQRGVAGERELRRQKQLPFRSPESVPGVGREVQGAERQRPQV